MHTSSGATIAPRLIGTFGLLTLVLAAACAPGQASTTAIIPPTAAKTVPALPQTGAPSSSIQPASPPPPDQPPATATLPALPTVAAPAGGPSAPTANVPPAPPPTLMPLPTDTPAPPRDPSPVVELPPTPEPAPPEPPPAARPRAPRPTVPVSAEEVVRGDPSRPWISLIFNAGAGFKSAPAILDTLAAKGVRTSFFLLGWWAADNPDLVRRMAADGQEIASHGHKVFDLTSVSNREVAADLERADEVISGITGRTTRPLWSASAGYRDARVNGIAASLGYRPIFWTVDSGDWREDATAAGVTRRVLDGAVNGAIIVMHTDSPRTADTIAPAIPSIIDGLRARGFRLVTITELVTGVLDEEVP